MEKNIITYDADKLFGKFMNVYLEYALQLCLQNINIQNFIENNKCMRI